MLKEVGLKLANKQDVIEIYEKTEKTTYTKYPNRYIDKIRPDLKKGEASICDYVIRKTYGYHRPFAEITLDNFVDNCAKPGTKRGYSQRQIVNAKNKLLTSGLLIKVENPNGSAHKGLYAINIFFDKPKQEETFNQAIPSQEPNPQITESLQTPVYNYVENPVQSPLPEAQESLEIQTETQESEISAEQAESSLQQAEDLQECAEPNSAHIVDHSLSLSQKNLKQTKQNWKSVCFDFCQRFGIDANSVYKVFNSLVESYGLDYLIEKLRLLYDFAKNHKVATPMGFLRSACKQNYDLPLAMRQKLEARKKAEYRIIETERQHAEFLKRVRDEEQWQARVVCAKERLLGKYEECIERAKAFYANMPFVIGNAIIAKANEFIVADYEKGLAQI